MAKILNDVSRTFSEYLLIPQLTKRAHVPSSVSLQASLGKHPAASTAFPRLNIPFVSASMQAVCSESVQTMVRTPPSTV